VATLGPAQFGPKRAHRFTVSGRFAHFA
jgi:hypothetical protein